jgi:hypothetical protein
MSKGLISIFALPQEIDALHLTLYNLKRNSVNLKNLPGSHEFGFDISLCMSEELTDWNKSLLPKEYFHDKFKYMKETLCSWATIESMEIRYTPKILGCVSHRRHSLEYLDKYDFTMWLDTDIFFDDYLLSYILMGVSAINNNTYVITPQVTRQWDTTWDVLVHPDEINKPLNNHLTQDVFEFALNGGENVALDSTMDNFKAAGGWCTVIGNDILKLTGIPKSFGHYGLEDTYVMQCCEIMRHSRDSRSPFIPKQYILKNVLIGENHKYQNNNYLKNLLCLKDRKDEFRQIAHSNFNQEIQNFIKRVYT